MGHRATVDERLPAADGGGVGVGNPLCRPPERAALRVGRRDAAARRQRQLRRQGGRFAGAVDHPPL